MGQENESEINFGFIIYNFLNLHEDGMKIAALTFSDCEVAGINSEAATFS